MKHEIVVSLEDEGEGETGTRCKGTNEMKCQGDRMIGCHWLKKNYMLDRIHEDLDQTSLVFDV